MEKVKREQEALDLAGKVVSLMSHRNVPLGRVTNNNLLSIYCQARRLEEAKTLFDSMGKDRDVVSWNIMIGGYGEQEDPDEAVEMFDSMLSSSSVRPTVVTFISALKAWASKGDLNRGKKVHKELLARGIGMTDVLVTVLIDMYGKCGSVNEAQRVFEKEGNKRSIFHWGGLIGAYCHEGQLDEALGLVGRMKEETGMAPNEAIFSNLLKACGMNGDLSRGRDLHRQLIENKLPRNDLLDTVLIDMYGKCGSLAEAQCVFDDISMRSVVHWTALMAAYCQHGHPEKVLALFDRMKKESPPMSPDAVIFVSALKACAALGDLSRGKEIHRQIESFGVEDLTELLLAMLVDMYTKCGSLRDAEKLFDNWVAERNRRGTTPWGAMIGAYNYHGMYHEALTLFDKMKRERGRLCSIDNVTLTNVVKACAGKSDLQLGRTLHQEINAAGIRADPILATALIYMYGSCGSPDDAQKVFDSLQHPADQVTWGALIGAYAHDSQQCERAFELVDMMEQQGVTPSAPIFIGVLAACGKRQALQMGQRLHQRIIDMGLLPHIRLENALLNMYASCGDLESAKRVFDSMPLRDTISYNILLYGYGVNGKGKELMDSFHIMRREKVILDDVSWTAVLSACSNCALVGEGLDIFRHMQESGVELNEHHYGCAVDLLAKAGWLEEAEGLTSRVLPKIRTVDAMVILKTLLGACRTQKEIYPTDASALVLMRNIFADAGRYEDASALRERMERDGIKKTPGTSWMEFNGKLHSFIAYEDRNPKYGRMT